MVVDDWPELKVDEDDGVPAAPEEVAFDAGTRLTSRSPAEDVLVSSEAAAVRSSFKQKDRINNLIIKPSSISTL